MTFNFTTLRVIGPFVEEPPVMIVCHCHRVCDRTIRAAVQAGACTEEAVGNVCGAGSMCGGCVPVVTEIIEEERRLQRRLPMITGAAGASAFQS
jgi:bacterioferritin-associated ferredoxin